MSRRTAKERRTSRTGQIHLCAVCVEDGGGYGSGCRVKQLTWMLEIPPDSDTCARLGGRPRTWFCRSCIEATFAGDPIFADRNRHLELEDPHWWTQPASNAQITYLTALLDQRVSTQTAAAGDRDSRRERHQRPSIPMAQSPRHRTVAAKDGRRRRHPRTTRHRPLKEPFFWQAAARTRG